MHIVRRAFVVAKGGNDVLSDDDEVSKEGEEGNGDEGVEANEQGEEGGEDEQRGEIEELERGG